MKRSQRFLVLIVLAALSFYAAKAGDVRGFHSNQQPQSWEEYLVSGNGTLGLMVAGYPYHEELVVNHTDLFMPCNPPSTPPSQGKHLTEIRQMMLEGKYKEASELLVEISHGDGFGKKRQSDLFIPAYQINIISDSLPLKSYRRGVNFMTGEATVEWSNKQGKFERRSFVSRADHVIVTEIRALRGKLNFTLDMEPVMRSDPKRKAKFGLDDNLGLKTITWDNIPFGTEGYGAMTLQVEYEKQFHGCSPGYEGETVYLCQGGTATIVKGHQLVVKDATSVLLLSAAQPVARHFFKTFPEIENKVTASSLPTETYEALLAPHQKTQADLMDRVNLHLVDDSINLRFDAARYNIISAISYNPPKLQGIWGATMTPPWAGDYTTNGNLPTAVSHLLSASTPELMLALFRKLESQMADYRTNARVLFNCRGIHIPSHIQMHGLDNQFDATWPMTFWTAGAAWYSLFYYDYYLYTKDEKFLTERALPFMKEAALFYEDFFYPQSPPLGGMSSDSILIFNPSYSPENHPKNSKSQACINATMDIAVCKALLRNLINISESHNINKEKLGLWKNMLARLPKYEVNKDGELREWTWQNFEDNHQHRHASHLIGMWYRKDPEIMQNDTLRNGVLKAIQQRLAYRKSQSGVMAFGLSQIDFPACLLGQSDLAEEMLTMAGNTYFNNNMMTTHDPHSIFNTDMSGAYPEMVMMMLAYSDVEQASNGQQSILIDLLPACPASWQEGSIDGMSLRGGIHMDHLAWDKEKVTAVLTSKQDLTVTVSLRGQQPKTILLKANTPTTVEF